MVVEEKNGNVEVPGVSKSKKAETFILQKTRKEKKSRNGKLASKFASLRHERYTYRRQGKATHYYSFDGCMGT